MKFHTDVRSPLMAEFYLYVWWTFDLSSKATIGLSFLLLSEIRYGYLLSPKDTFYWLFFSFYYLSLSKIAWIDWHSIWHWHSWSSKMIKPSFCFFTSFSSLYYFVLTCSFSCHWNMLKALKPCIFTPKLWITWWSENLSWFCSCTHWNKHINECVSQTARMYCARKTAFLR